MSTENNKILFKKKKGNLYHGVSKENLDCYIVNRQFTTIGSTGYVVIPYSLLTNEFYKDHDKLSELFEHSDVNVHGGITYIEKNLCGEDVGKDVIVIGFDTSHYHSPRNASMEFMEKELIKLSKFASSEIIKINLAKKQFY